ncbi:uncharacterized protein LOC106088010 [Stomoxys calcitrans]|uniref:uncharacterized protein LOC106088010 n=1 Tax=Stomoxys calcitrans TaxID=35570 RepID=UPI0027E2922C|nr:uncharacterized protein LOC106088010 [Stomoxys calcitrans]
MAQTNSGSNVVSTTTTITPEPSTKPCRLTLQEKTPELPKNVGHLLKEPVEIDCPACQRHNTTRVEKDAVTFWQKLAALINCCCCCCKDVIKWEGRYDYNHYCSQCGCYIGRYITPTWSQRRMMRQQHLKLEVEKFCDEIGQDIKEHFESKDELPPVQSAPPSSSTTPAIGQK